MQTSREGVFAAGDVVTGPNTVVEAIRAGKKSAEMIDRFLRAEPLLKTAKPKLPKVWVEPIKSEEGSDELSRRAETLRAPAEWRKRNFAEVEVSLSVEEAMREATRCLRCDMEFTMQYANQNAEVEPIKEVEYD
jgi:NADPH-dependent glutamate synthase beta subunit-like oxidoreductase